MVQDFERMSRRWLVLALILVVAFATTAKANAQDGGPTPYAPPDNIGDLEGEVVADGSSTVGPITIAAAEGFNEVASNVDISVSISGTGGGFEKFCNDETDLQDASRPINDDEAATCADNGVSWYEFEVAFDGITIVVPESNTFLTCLSTDVLKQIWMGEVTNYNQINPEFPDLGIQLFGPDSESGTFDFFNEEILGEDDAGEVLEPAADYEPSSDDNVLVEGVSGTEGGLGYFGFAYYETAQDRLNAVGITADGDPNNCVSPSPDTIRAGEYAPLSRPLYVYVKASSLADNPALQEFLRFYIAGASDIAKATGAVDAPGEDLAASQTKLEDAISGSAAPDSESFGTPEA
jgi:phosphate transport system substrate-binding protein